MIIIFEEGDLVEFKNRYWRIMSCNRVARTVDLKNAIGHWIEDVSLDVITPCASTIKEATTQTQKD